MSKQSTTERIPEWDTADRMRKALRDQGMSVNDMADYLDVRRETISKWLTGKITPSTQTLRVWAMRTGVPYEWLTWSEGYDPRDPEPSSSDYLAIVLDIHQKRKMATRPGNRKDTRGPQGRAA